MSEAAPMFGDLLCKLGLITPHQLQEALSLQSLTGQRVGEALVSMGYVSREQLQGALLELLGLSQREVTERPRLGEILVGLKHVTPAQLEVALARQKQDGRRLGEILVELGHCSFKQIYEAIAVQQRDQKKHVAPSPTSSSSQVKVVVVDDSPLACNLVNEGLTRLGYQVHCFQDPYEGLEQIHRLKPAIVLSDLEMPGMDGAELCRRLKGSPAKAIPVIILTANDDDAQKVGGLRAGADDYVNKAASMEELAARIDTVVRRTGETERMRKLFARYTSDAVVEEVLNNPAEVILTGEKREVTILFADLRGFTTLAESLPAEQVVSILNEVLGRLSDAVLTCGGTLDKFTGDGVMALFGAPVRRPDDTLRALQSAQIMMAAVAQLNLDRRRDSAAASFELALGIGINTGVVVVGSLGSAARAEYTCIGDAVNVAARLCALAGPNEILVGQRTRELVESAGRFEDLPPVKLKGKANPVPLFRMRWNPNELIAAAPGPAGP